MDEICEREKCTGCCACLATCPHTAITMREDECGFLYPFIDLTRCINCGLCRKVCPNNVSLRYNVVKKVFIGCASDHEEQRTSASGGLASVLARQILKGGGVVYGCSGQDIRSVKHVRIDDEIKLNEIKGSKYVQSYIGRLFLSVKQDLANDKRVLFVGTPCVIAGLKVFLKKEYVNLITVDIVCHGVPAQRILNSALDEYLQVKKDAVVHFREKSKSGKVNYGLFIWDVSNRRVVNERFPKNLYVTGFLQGLYYRESCYACKFACRDRMSDITLGDYWDKHSQYSELRKRNLGLSMILVNTEHGMTFLAECRSLLKMAEGSLENVVEENGQLSRPMSKHANYESFKRLYISMGFVYAAKMSLKTDIKMLTKGLILNKIAYGLYQVPGMRRLRQVFRRG